MSGHSKWNNIKATKEKTDAQRAKAFTKIGKEIMVAIKIGGVDPTANPRLKLAIQKAKAVNMPNDKINAYLKKNAEQDTSNYYDLTYEGYGVGGVAVVVKCLTDNKNRTSSDVRFIFDKFGGSLGSNGCVSYLFDHKGIITIEKNTDFDVEKAVDIAIENDVIDFEDGDVFAVITTPSTLDNVTEQYKNNNFVILSSVSEMVPQNYIKLDDDKRVTFEKMLDKFDDCDDVQEVYHNLEED